MKNIILKNSTINDCKLYFKLKYNKHNLLASINNYKETYPNHVTWMKKKLKQKMNIYKTIYFNKKKIGYLRLDKVNFYYTISIAGVKKYYGKGYYSKALENIQRNFKKNSLLVSEIKKNNKTSIKFFERNNFIKIDDNKNILIYAKFINKYSKNNAQRIIDQIEMNRKKNNVNWMELLRLSFDNNFYKTKNIFDKIKNVDKNINILSSKIK